MFQVAYDYADAWPESGSLHVDVRLTSDIIVSPTVAQRRAKGYLTLNVGLFVTTATPTLLLGNQTPIWRVPAMLRLPGRGKIAAIGSIDVNAQSGEILPLSEEQILTMQSLSHALAARLPSLTTPMG